MSETDKDCSGGPAVEKEHVWLQQFAGEWTFEGEAQAAPGEKPFQFHGTESTAPVGDLWVVGVGQGEGMPFFYRLTLGYDTRRKQITGSWIDSMHAHLWVYEGSIEGNVLTLDTEGPSPGGQGLAKFRETSEFPDKNTRIFTSNIMGADGKYAPMMRITFRRKN